MFILDSPVVEVKFFSLFYPNYLNQKEKSRIIHQSKAVYVVSIRFHVSDKKIKLKIGKCCRLLQGNKPHGVISKKTSIFIFTGLKTSSVTKVKLCLHIQRSSIIITILIIIY